MKKPPREPKGELLAPADIPAEPFSDLSVPTPLDLAEPEEIKTLAFAGGQVVPVMAPPEPRPEYPLTVPQVVALALILVDDLAIRCGDGWTPCLADIRKLRAQIAALEPVFPAV